MKRLAFLPIAALALGACQDATQSEAPVLPAQFSHATTPSFGGTYNFLSFSSSAPSDGVLQRFIEFGTATFGATDGTFTIEFVGGTGAQQTQECNFICTRRFMRFTAPLDDLPQTFPGTYVLTADNQLLITVDVFTLVAYTNPSGTIIILPFFEDAEDGSLQFLIFMKQGSDLSTSTLDGTFFTARFASNLLPASGEFETTWPGPLTTLVGSGTMGFSNGNATVTRDQSVMTQETVTCTPTDTGCTITATLQERPRHRENTFAVSVTSDGTIMFPNSIGTLSADGDFFMLPHPRADAGIIIGTRASPGISNTSLKGTYNIIAFADNFNSSGDISTDLTTGTATFDGIDEVNFTITATRLTRSELCEAPEAPAPCAISSDLSAEEGNVFAAYNVSPNNGEVTIEGAAVESITGVLSPDASFILLTTGFDNDCTNGGCDSERVLIIGVKAPVHPLPEQQIEAVIGELEGLVAENLGTPLADKVEDALAKAQTALGELSKTPPDNQAAVGNIGGAVGDLAAAVEDGLLDPARGAQLMDQLAGIARQLAVNALDEAMARAGDPTVIADAEQFLADGDALRASGAFKDAVNKYKDALAKAESA